MSGPYHGTRVEASSGRRPRRSGACRTEPGRAPRGRCWVRVGRRSVSTTIADRAGRFDTARRKRSGSSTASGAWLVEVGQMGDLVAHRPAGRRGRGRPARPWSSGGEEGVEDVRTRQQVVAERDQDQRPSVVRPPLLRARRSRAPRRCRPDRPATTEHRRDARRSAGATTGCSIFIASITTIVSPASTRVADRAQDPDDGAGHGCLERSRRELGHRDREPLDGNEAAGPGRLSTYTASARWTARRWRTPSCSSSTRSAMPAARPQVVDRCRRRPAANDPSADAGTVTVDGPSPSSVERRRLRGGRRRCASPRGIVGAGPRRWRVARPQRRGRRRRAWSRSIRRLDRRGWRARRGRGVRGSRCRWRRRGTRGAQDADRARSRFVDDAVDLGADAARRPACGPPRHGSAPTR